MTTKTIKAAQRQYVGSASPGFTNPGFICYQSSVLQALFHYMPFTTWLNNLRLSSSEDGLTRQLKKILQVYQGQRSMEELGEANIALCQRMSELGILNYGRYEDAGEFFIHLVRQLWIELGESAFSNVRGLLSMFSSVTIKMCLFSDCPTNRQPGPATDTLGVRGILLEGIERQNKFHDVNLDHLLDIAWGPQIYEGNCDNQQCQGHVSVRRARNRMVKTENLTTFPEMLLVFVDRVQVTYDNTSKDRSVRSKIDWPVTIPDRLYMDRYSWASQQCQYKLFGVVSHQGDPENGHYKAIIKDPVNDRWLEFDDSTISLLASRTKHDRAFESQNGYPPAAEAAWSFDGFTPFLVFYLETPEDAQGTVDI